MSDEIPTTDDTEVKNSEVNENSPFFQHNHGFKPYLMALYGFFISVATGAFIYGIECIDAVYVAPSDIFTYFPRWSMANVALFHLIIYACSILCSLFVITLKGFSYSLWVVKQQMPVILMAFFGVESALFLLNTFGLNASTIYINRYRESLGMSMMENYLWGGSMIFSFVITWTGYFVSWRGYRKFGTQTMQDRYENYLASLKRKNAGRFWDKYIAYPFSLVFGKNGSLPPYMMWYFIILMPMMWVIPGAFITALQADERVFFPINVVASVSSVLIIAAITKSRDVKTKKHLPFLLPVRDKNTVDTYHPELSSAWRP